LPVKGVAIAGEELLPHNQRAPKRRIANEEMAFTTKLRPCLDAFRTQAPSPEPANLTPITIITIITHHADNDPRFPFLW